MQTDIVHLALLQRGKRSEAAKVPVFLPQQRLVPVDGALLAGGLSGISASAQQAAIFTA